MRIIDSHAHLDDPQFDHDREYLFSEMASIGIEMAIIPGISPPFWPKQLEVAKQYACPYALGLHPWFCGDSLTSDIEQLKALLALKGNDPQLVAIGECGLDKIKKANWAQQELALEQQLIIAKLLNLPVILHVVKAHNEMLTILKRHALPKAGVIHGFYGSIEVANEYIKLGYKLGLGGLILNSNAKKLKQCVSQLPLNAFIIETDSPAMVPQNSADLRNTPLILQRIIYEIANLQKKSSVLISEHAFRNTVQLFDLKLILI